MFSPNTESTSNHQYMIMNKNMELSQLQQVTLISMYVVSIV